jgi:hypothetical protein
MNARLLDLSATPFRRLTLSTRHDVWCLVDADDWPWIIHTNWNFGWHAKTRWKYYAKRNVGTARSTVYLHREILRRAYPEVDPAELHGDHINGQSLDNRKVNLRYLTPEDNARSRCRREHVPSLDAIVAALLRSPRVQAQAELAAVPF